jgi:hypothetical protein
MEYKDPCELEPSTSPIPVKPSSIEGFNKLKDLVPYFFFFFYIILLVTYHEKLFKKGGRSLQKNDQK